MPDTPGSPRYAQLQQRATDALALAPGGLTALELAGALFGATLGDRWVPVIDAVLATAEQIEFRDGRWHIVGPPTPQLDDPQLTASMLRVFASTDVSTFILPTDSVITLALATTGADPRHHRITRIAVIRRDEDVTTARFDAAVRLERSPRSHHQTAARSSDDDRVCDPAFVDIVPSLRELIAGQTVYVYDARRAAAFLQAETRRADLPEIRADFVELDELVQDLMPESHKPSLRAAAREFGLPYAAPGLPESDAFLAARLVERLRDRQSASPGRTALPADPADSPRLPAALPPFTRAWLNSVPEGPGVYLFEDSDGQTLYIGKASSLYRRLSDYVRRQPTAHRQFEALAVRAARAPVIQTRSDLEATLLEARLIRERAPAFNVARQPRPPTLLVRAAPDDASPRVQLVAELRSDGARYFGPLESVAAARKMLALARETFPAAFPRRRGDRQRQRDAVLEVCQLLAGQKTSAFQTLQTRMREAASQGDQQAVDRLRAALRDIQQLEIRPSVLAGFGQGTMLLVLEQVSTGDTRTHLLEDGRRLASVSWQMDSLPADPVRLKQLAGDILEAAEHAAARHSSAAAAEALDADELPRSHDDDDWTEDDLPDDISVGTLPADPDEPALVLRWVTQAWGRIELARVPTSPRQI